eukprot:Hpha_TRINITY_DN13092_c0_g1::TRINITY_DN13092_c0_g1_i1::g.68959::m.68959
MEGLKKQITKKEMVVREGTDKSAKGCGRYAAFPLEVVAISAKGLTAMDDDGKSDPYLEMKLRRVVDGKIVTAHPRPQNQVTPCARKTLTPEWNSKHVFSTSGDDALHCFCYDKDVKGKDLLGKFTVKMTELDLKPGDKPVKKTLKLEGELDIGGGKTKPATGTVDVTFAIPKA